MRRKRDDEGTPEEPAVYHVNEWKILPTSVEIAVDEEEVVMTFQVEGTEGQEILAYFPGYFARAIGELLYTSGCDADAYAEAAGKKD